MLYDCRCPRCNDTVDGKSQEVRVIKKLPKAVASCKSCKTPIRLLNTSDDLGQTMYYDFVKRPKGW